MTPGGAMERSYGSPALMVSLSLDRSHVPKEKISPLKCDTDISQREVELRMNEA
ncbi:hypothetical protein BGZ68_004700, partial [Mortierella alpina]